MGCALIPETLHQPQFHNPLPQLHRVAVLPFFNQSENPYVDPDLVAERYIHELQTIPGFEVVPLGFAKNVMAASGIRGDTRGDFRKLARLMQVDAVVVGSVTEYDPYYPPRMGLAVDWYAASECFHPIPPGYGLPWGSAEEEYIPDEIVQEAEFALARAQLATQTPRPPEQGTGESSDDEDATDPDSDTPEAIPPPSFPGQTAQSLAVDVPSSAKRALAYASGSASPPSDFPLPPSDFRLPTSDFSLLPPDWPDPSGFVPDAPQPAPPACRPQDGPVLTHVRVYDAADGDFTASLQHWYRFRVDGRGGDWRGVLQRSDDFVRFCCYQHITSMLASRGGAGKTRVVYQWPLSR